MKKLTFFVLLVLPAIVYGQPAKEYYVEATEHYRAGQWNEAVKMALKAKNMLGSTNPKLEGFLARAYYQKGDIIEAKLAYEKLLKLSPSELRRSSSFEQIRTLGKQIDAALTDEEEGFEQEQKNKKKRAMQEAEKIEKEWTARENERKRMLKNESKDDRYFFNKASSIGSIDAYREFADQFPNSDLNIEAEIKISDLKRQRKEAILRQNRTEYAAPLIDPRDGQRYKTVNIGGQIIMAENLNYKMQGSYKTGVETNGDPKIFGRLYTFEAAQKACPPGWRLYNTYDWGGIIFSTISLDLYQNFGITADGYFGKLFKSSYGWDTYVDDQIAYDSYGFRALPVGYGVLKKRKLVGKKAFYFEVGYIASFWTSTTAQNNSQIGLTFELSVSDNNYDYKQRNKETFLAACRCAKVR